MRRVMMLTGRFTIRSLLTGLAVLAVCAPAAQAAVDADLIDRQLQRRSIRFVSYADGQIRYFDADRQLRTSDVQPFVALRLLRENMESEESPGSLWLVDGHVIHGHLDGVNDEGHLVWQSGLLGRLMVPLDQVRIIYKGAARTPVDVPAGTDRIMLVNGDVLVGYVSNIASDTIAIDTAQRTVQVPWARVASVRLGNAPRPRPGVWVRLVDGGYVRLDHLRIDPDTVAGIGFDGRAVSFPARKLEQVDFAEQERLVPLGDMPRQIVSGGEVFGVPMPPRMDADAADLHAPIVVRFELPPGASRFAADVALASSDHAWADMVLSIVDEKGDLLKQRLNRDQPSARINIAVRSGELTVRLDEGVNGPVQDRLRLTNAFVLIPAAK